VTPLIKEIGIIMQLAEKKEQGFEDFGELFEASLVESDIKEGDVVKGNVIAIKNGLVFIDVGLKSDGRIDLKEFEFKAEDVKVGDKVEVYVEKLENKNGELVLSRERAMREAAWVDMEDAAEKGIHVKGVIFGKVKGGFTVNIQGTVAFLPGSQVDVRPIKDITPLIGIEQPFVILKMDRKRGNIVVSRRAIMEESRQGQRDEILENIREGDTIEGMVKNITDYGAFIDLGGVDGLLHVTDISWKRVNHPSEVFSVGDSIKVMVTKFDQDTKRISLGMKQLEENPWEGAEHIYVAGARFAGKVSNITDYGVFVEMEDGIEGLVHVSEMSWTKKNVHPSKIIALGDKVDVMVLEVEPSKHRISLGMKQCQENPWEQFAQKNNVSDVVEASITNITEFGLFISLADDIDGLIHHSDIAWEHSGEEAVKDYKKGDIVKAKILLIDPEKERIGLGIKQLSEQPASSATIKKGQVVTCEIVEVSEEGLNVRLSDGSEGNIKKIDISSDRKEQRPDRFAVGDRVDAKITNVGKKGETALSIKLLEIEQNKQAIKDFGSSDSGATLGDILGAALSKVEVK
jgi:small subunit ribosomal protein S1